MKRSPASDLERRIGERRRIYLIRHGAVSYFDGVGKPVPPLVVPLNASGIRQAEAARDFLLPVAIDRIVSTGLPRTDQTAEIIAEGRGVSIESHPELQEVRPGRLLDPANPDFERKFTRALDGGEDGAEITRATQFLGGETFGSLQDRAIPAFETVLADASWREIIIVAHGGTNRIILLHALGAGLSCLGRFEQDAGCINVIDVDPARKCLVRLVNHTPSAPAKEGLRATTMEQIFLEHLWRRAP